MCAFAAVVGIIMCAHFLNRHNALLFTLCLHTEAIVYHLHCGNYFINKILGLFMQKKPRIQTFFSHIFSLTDAQISCLLCHRWRSIAWHFECKVLYSYTVNLSLHENFFDSHIFSSDFFFLQILFTFFYRVFSLFLIFLSIFFSCFFLASVQFFRLLEHICFLFFKKQFIMFA